MTSVIGIQRVLLCALMRAFIILIFSSLPVTVEWPRVGEESGIHGACFDCDSMGCTGSVLVAVEQSSIACHCCPPPSLSILCCRLKSHLLSLSHLTALICTVPAQ